MEHHLDQGTKFGTWTDKVSKFMYHDSLELALPHMDMSGRIGDYGGANGLLKQALPDADITTIDHDPSKQPDIVDDVLTHSGIYDVGFCRFVLHYLTDLQVLELARHLRVHCDRVYIVQFTNDGPSLRAKYMNSVMADEPQRYFRTSAQLYSLLGDTQMITTAAYTVGDDFYRNRLGMQGALEHQERLSVLRLVQAYEH